MSLPCLLTHVQALPSRLWGAGDQAAGEERTEVAFPKRSLYPRTAVSREPGDLGRSGVVGLHEEMRDPGRSGARTHPAQYILGNPGQPRSQEV